LNIGQNVEGKSKSDEGTKKDESESQDKKDKDKETAV
jgi:hypothetical protein